ncbi:hypothetical protein PAMA110636_17030 [Paenibacillus macerans]
MLEIVRQFVRKRFGEVKQTSREEWSKTPGKMKGP